MCDSLNHKHNRVEEWVTPINSKHLSSKMVHLFPGDHIHAHTTGPGREEVLIVLFGSITVTLQEKFQSVATTVDSGHTIFIPENTVHAVSNDGDAPAQYAYVCTKRESVPRCLACGAVGEELIEGLCEQCEAGKELCAVR